MNQCLHHTLVKQSVGDELYNYRCTDCSVNFYLAQNKDQLAEATGREGGKKLAKERGSAYMSELGKRAAEKRWGKTDGNKSAK